MAKPPRLWQRWMRANIHEHSCLDIMIVLSGRDCYGLDGAIYNSLPGTIFIFQPYQPHPFGYPPFHGNFSHLWISVTRGEVLARLVSGRRNRVNYRDRTNSIVTLEQCGLPCPLSLPPARATPTELNLRFMALVAALIAGIISADDQRNAQLLDRQTLRSRKIAAIRRYIMDTGGSNANLEHLAHLAGYSKFHFLRVFKQETRQTVHAYVNQCRRRKARELHAAGISMKEIADQLGFASASAFSHWYRT